LQKKKKRTRSEAGFTLLEVLLAVVILGVSLTTILLQFQTALHAGRISQERTNAVIYAKEKLESLKIENELSESSQSGVLENGHEWETEISLYEYEDQAEDISYEDLRHETYKLRATVKWNSGINKRQIELITLKTVTRKEWAK
jgi:prepilin-type N-terminal cleavage/methylation domain-containing protein